MAPRHRVNQVEHKIQFVFFTKYAIFASEPTNMVMVSELVQLIQTVVSTIVNLEIQFEARFTYFPLFTIHCFQFKYRKFSH